MLHTISSCTDIIFNKFKACKIALLAIIACALSSCNATGILNPKGLIANIEQDLLIYATILMLIIVVPVILLTLWFAWRYRASNKKATYSPNWCHSVKLEAICWGAPIIIIIVLAWMTWVYTQDLDPYKPIDSDKKPVQIQAISLEWKWLFIYPEYGIAAVNEIQLPVDTPINFKITADSAMNAFMIPQLGSQIYAMEGMQTKLHLIADTPGNYPGMSANYSGYGFSGMRFNVRVGSDEEFLNWVQDAKTSPLQLSLDRYNKLAMPTRYHQVEKFSVVEPHLFKRIIEKFMQPDSKGFVSQEKRRISETTRKTHH